MVKNVERVVDAYYAHRKGLITFKEYIEILEEVVGIVTIKKEAQ